MKDNQETKKQLVSANVVAEYANLSHLTLGRWRSEKINFPYFLVGGAVKYDLNEIIEIIDGGRVNVGGVKRVKQTTENNQQ